ncbi:MAG: ATP-binding cassette domain-containing protein [Spirochaetaceae bacterium]|jgi:ATP-binding cassette subfamily B protein/ATP-binding cassette subfamily C protein|nr:ATP-binding cassette domain-containing protein [Spirochaetaceae bacterium]
MQMIFFRYLRGSRRVISEVFALLSRLQKFYLIILFGLTLLLSAVETVGISVIMPFISIASSPDLIDNGVYKKVYDFFAFSTKMDFVFYFGIAIILFYFFRSLYFILYTYLQTKFALGMSRILANRIFKIFLGIPYKAYVQRNQAEIMRAIGEAGSVSSLLLSILQICTETVMIIMLYSLIIALNWIITLVVTAILGITMLFVMRILSINKAEGKKRYEASLQQERIILETLGNIKFVKLSGKEEKMQSNFGVFSAKAARSNVIISTLGNSPRSILESVGFTVLISTILFILWKYKTPVLIISTISMYALALYRILPSIHRLLGYIGQVFSLRRSLEVVNMALNQKIEAEESEPLQFNSKIELKNICFTYLTGSEVLHNISLEINKGDSVAITGSSGSGKSTLVDILIGIHKSDSGMFLVDGVPVTNKNIRSWRAHIGYIPQDIFLFDGSVANNVAFGVEPDEEKVIKALQMAHIWDFLCTKDGINTRVGGNGILLSGGQRQRIGIARALYNDPEVLVLDEATSALDNETESKIMDEIYSLSSNKTLIIIAHRISTVEHCKKRIYLEQGSISC